MGWVVRARAVMCSAEKVMAGQGSGEAGLEATVMEVPDYSAMAMEVM